MADMTESERGTRAQFAVPAEAYDALMGRYLPTLGPAVADAADVRAGQRVLDVGCGPGGLTGELVDRVGADSVSAVDPSTPFVAACRERHPGVDVREGVAENLPFDDDTFDVALSSLVVGFMTDPVAGAAEMCRVTRPGGTVALCFWDLQRMPTLNLYWEAAAAVAGAPPDDLRRPGGSPGELADFLRRAALEDVRESVLTATSDYRDLDDWWRAFTYGVGPAGQHYQSLSAEQQGRMHELCAERLGNPEGPFTLTAHAWCAVATVAAG